MKKIDLNKETIKKIANSITNIEVCENCRKVVSIKIFGSLRWSIKGFFQCGGNKKRLYSWCSDECFNLVK